MSARVIREAKREHMRPEMREIIISVPFSAKRDDFLRYLGLYVLGRSFLAETKHCNKQGNSVGVACVICIQD